jgi:hypothetical protein
MNFQQFLSFFLKNTKMKCIPICLQEQLTDIMDNGYLLDEHQQQLCLVKTEK